MTIDVDEAVAALPRCPTCQVPQVGDECLHCRLMDVEAKLARVSFWGDDDWAQKVASLAIIERPKDSLYPLGFYEDFSDRQGQFTFNIVQRPQVSFKPLMLTVAPECAYMGTLLDFMVGNRSQVVDGSGRYPLSLFSPASYSSPEMMREIVGKFHWDMVQVAQTITLSVDLSIEKYDPLVKMARDSMHMPTPTAFKAVLWGRLIEHDAEPAVKLHWAGPENVKDVEATLQFADVVNKIRGGTLLRG